MAHGVLPLHHTPQNQKYRRRVFYGQPSLWQRLAGGLLSSRWARRLFIALSALLIIYRLSTHVPFAPADVPDLSTPDPAPPQNAKFDDAQLRAAGITNIGEAVPQLDDVDVDDAEEDNKEEAVPLPDQAGPTTAATEEEEDIAQEEDAIRILEEELADEEDDAVKNSFSRRWALEGADGSGLDALKAAIARLVESTPVVVFSKTTCPYSAAAKALLERKGVKQFFVEVDRRSDTLVVKQALNQLTGHNTFPNIFIGGSFIGGSDTLHALDKGGQLDTLLRKAGVLPRIRVP